VNKDQYQTLCCLTDEILKECAENSVSVAIPWLHIIREHPGSLKDYEFLFKNETWCLFQFNLLKRLIRNLLSSCKVILKSLLMDSPRTWLQMIDRLPQTDVLFISHLLNPKQYEDKEDFYFSNLPQKLADDGCRSVTVLLNHSGVSSNQYSLKQDNTRSKLVFPDTMKVRLEMLNVTRLWKESRSLKRAAKVEQDPLKKKFFYGLPWKP
jgi:hypothetical protein